MALKEKEGKMSKVSELQPWPTYIVVRISEINQQVYF